MPTGYTADVANGKITNFRDYAIQCSRAFGCFVQFRDEPLSTKLPKLKLDNYHLEAIESLKEELDNIEKFPEIEYQKYIDSNKKYNTESLKEKREQRNRYNKMLEMANKFVPPTLEHCNYKKFIVEQLLDSIKWDCNEEYDLQRLEELDKINVQQWAEERKQKINEEIVYHTKRHAETVKKYEDRNKWIELLTKEIERVENEYSSITN